MKLSTSQRSTSKAATRRIHPLHRWLAGLCVLVLLGFQVAAASAALHRVVHEDSGQSDHQCAITLFTHGLVDAAPVGLTLRPPASADSAVLIVSSLPAPTPARLLPPGRAPPAIPAR